MDHCLRYKDRLRIKVASTGQNMPKNWNYSQFVLLGIKNKYIQRKKTSGERDLTKLRLVETREDDSASLPTTEHISHQILQEEVNGSTRKTFESTIISPLPQHHFDFVGWVWSQNLRLPGMLSNTPSSAAFPSQATSAGGEGLNKSPLRVSIITFYLTSTRLWFLAAFDQVYTISVS